MRNLLRYFIVILFLWPSYSQVFASENQTYTRSSLVARAVGGSPIVAAAEAEMDVFEAKLRYADRWWIPRLQFSSIASALPKEWGNALEGGTDFSEWGPLTQNQLTVGMALYTFGKVQSLKEMAKAGIDISEAKRDLARKSVEAYVDKALTAVLFARELLVLLEDGRVKVQRARTRLEALEEQDSDDYDPTDMQRLKIVEGELEERRLDALALEDKGLIGLRLLCGLEPSDPVRVASKLKNYAPKVSESEEASLVLARSHRIELKAIAFALKAGDAAAAYAKSTLLPNLMLGGFARYAFAPSADDQASPFAYDPYNIFTGGAGLMLKWNLDVPKSLMLMDEADARKRQLLAQQMTLYGLVELDVRNAWKRMERSEQMRRWTRKGTKAARGWLTAKADLFDAGLAQYGDVSKAVKAYYERRFKEISSYYEDALARVSLANAIGISFEE